MKNKYLKGTRISERKFREVLRYFAHDLPVLTAARLCGLNYRTVHRLASRDSSAMTELPPSATPRTRANASEAPANNG